jgi:mono/diheme cytochrome c family protein
LAILVAAIILVIGVAVLFGAYEIFGGYDVAADTPHSAALFWLADTTRRHSIAVSAASISVPLGFGSEAQVKAGASEYAEMCAQCHLGPGVERSEISQGLYPRAPELAHEGTRNPAEQFWVIKHGIKMSGMAAWGPTHSDKIIWSIAAFLQKLPDLSPAQYKAMTKDAAENHDEMRDMPGMAH